MEIPILSISQIGLKNEGQPSLEAFKLCGENLKRAFSSVGFIYIKDHGIDEKLIEKSMEASKNYFLLPQDVKESFPRLEIVIFYTEILMRKVVLWCFLTSETSEKIHNSTF